MKTGSIRNISMRNIYLSLAILLLLGGCSSKQCGIDEEVFKRFSLQTQEQICKLYAKQQAEAKKLAQQRRLIEAKNRHLRLKNEHIKLKLLYKEYAAHGDSDSILSLALRGKIIVGKKSYEIYPLEFAIARGEAKKICVLYRHGRGCFWVAYKDDTIYFNIIPDPKKRWMKRYMIEEDIRTFDDSVIIDVDTIRATTIVFEKRGIIYHLRAHIHPY